MNNPIKTASRADDRAVEAAIEMNGLRVAIRASISGSGSQDQPGCLEADFASSQLLGLTSGLQAVTAELLPRALQEFDAALTHQESTRLQALSEALSL